MQSLKIVFTGVNQVELCTDSVPEPGPDEVLIRTHKTLISTGTEGIVLSRLFDPDTHWDRWAVYPFFPGYSLVGDVVAVGHEVEGLSPGDRVAARRPHQQYVLSPAARVVPVPAGVSDEDATWFGLANIVQNGVRRAEHMLGETVVVIGMGLLGQLVVQYMRLLGARAVIAVDPVEQRIAMARAHGATAVIAGTAATVREEVLRLTDGAGADVVYDVTGFPEVLPAALKLLRRFGRLILLGDTGRPASQQLTGELVTKGLRIIGAHDGNPPQISTDHAYWSHERMTDLFFTYLQRGDMGVSDLITHRYVPGEAVDAYEMLRTHRALAMGVIFDWTSI